MRRRRCDVRGHRLFRRLLLSLLNCTKRAGKGCLAVPEPVGRPKPVEPPALLAENLLPQEVPISRRLRAVVRGSVAFDAEEVTLRIARIADSKVDTVVARSDLLVDHVTALAEKLR